MQWMHRGHSPAWWTDEYRQRIEYLRSSAADCFFQDKNSRQKKAALRPLLSETKQRLLGLADHVVHGCVPTGVRQSGVAALGRHEALLALVTLDGMGVEGVVALGDAILPCGLVAELRRTGHAGGVTGHAGLIVGALAIGSLRSRNHAVRHRGGAGHDQLAHRLYARGDPGICGGRAARSSAR